jgi:hypothetical protein
MSVSTPVRNLFPTATQNVGDVHETLAKLSFWVSTLGTVLHAVPSHASVPSNPTAMQKVAEEQDTEARLFTGDPAGG